MRNLEVIGEATGHVPDEIRQRYAKIPWVEMRDMRNLLSHEYFGVDPEIVWKTVQTDLPAILPALRRMLEES